MGLWGCAAHDYPVRADSPPTFAGPLSSFCQQAQYLLTDTHLRAGNIVHGDYDAFVKSKAQINPLTTQQLVAYLDAERREPRMISCKLKTVDNVIAEFGGDAAGTEGSCRDIHELVVRELLAGLPEQDVRQVIVDDDLVVDINADPGAALGPEWLKPHTLVYLGSDGKLHIRAKEFRVDWGDARFAAAPPQFRGIHYCHVIAPAYLRRLVTGAVPLPVTEGGMPAG